MSAKFKFVVDCIDKESCETVKQHMKENGFKNIRDIKGSLSGDHSAVKELSSLNAAKKEASILHKKHINKIRQIAII